MFQRHFSSFDQKATIDKKRKNCLWCNDLVHPLCALSGHLGWGGRGVLSLFPINPMMHWKLSPDTMGHFYVKRNYYTAMVSYLDTHDLTKASRDRNWPHRPEGSSQEGLNQKGGPPPRLKCILVWGAFYWKAFLWQQCSCLRCSWGTFDHDATLLTSHEYSLFELMISSLEENLQK